MSSPDEKEHTFTINQAEIDRLVKVELLKLRVDVIETNERNHQRKEEDSWKTVFQKLESIQAMQGEFPLMIQVKLHEQKSEIEKDMAEKYLTKLEMKTMLRTAIIIGGLAMTAVNAAFTYAIINTSTPTTEQTIRRVIEKTIDAEISKRPKAGNIQ